MAAKTGGGGKGSNQYQSRGKGTLAEQAARVGTGVMRDAIERELVAQAFADNQTIKEQGKALGAKRSLDALIARASSTLDQRGKVASMRSCPPELLTVLADDPDLYVQERVAWNPSTPPDVLMHLVGSDSRRVRRAVAKHAAPGPWTEKVATDDHYQVRVFAAKNPNLPLEWQQRLATDRDHRVRAAVADTTTNPELLVRLASDPKALVRHAVVKNPSTPTGTAAAMVDDASIRTRELLAYRDDCSPELFSRLEADIYESVRDNAEKAARRRGQRG